MNKNLWIGIAALTFVVWTYSCEAATAPSGSTATVNNSTNGGDDAIPETFFGLSFNHSIPNINFGSTRTWDSLDISWARLNPARGVYNWGPLDNFIAEMDRLGGKEILFTFGRSPSWATGGKCTGYYAPDGCAEPPANIADWDAFVTAIITKYKDKIKYWETWNEFNDVGFFTGTMADMIPLARRLYQIAHSIDPNAVVVSPNSYATPTWLVCYLKPAGQPCTVDNVWIGPSDRSSGGAQWADVIAYHDAYLSESLPLDSRLKEYKSMLADAGLGDKPVWDTESSFGDPRTLTHDQMRGQVAARYLLMWSNDVSRFLWYTWDTANLGMLQDTNTMGPNQEGVAYDQIYKWMVGATMTSKCVRSGNGTWTCGLSRANGYQALAVWNDSGSQLSYSVPRQYTQYRDLAGGIQSINGGTVPIGLVPILLEAESVSVTIPTINIITPSNGSIVKGVVNVQASASDGSAAVVSVSFKLDNGNPVVDTTYPYAVNWNTTYSTSGTHTLTAIAKDAAGNTSSPHVITITVNNTTVDTIAPQVNITSPSNSSTVKGTVSIQASASDNVGVSSVSFKLDNGIPVVDTTSPYQVNWNTTYSTSGTHTLTAIAKDAAGNQSSASVITVTVNNTASAGDTTLPTVTITSPSNNSTVSGTISIQAQASDNSGSLASVSFKLDNGNPVVDTTAPYQVNWNTNYSASGTHTLTATAKDPSGNQKTTTITVTVVR